MTWGYLIGQLEVPTQRPGPADLAHWPAAQGTCLPAHHPHTYLPILVCSIGHHRMSRT